nr:ribonuclease H-like domain-containing protein [Tanacetum cinerariifolium]
TNEVNTAYRVSTTNTQVSPASTQVSTASTQDSTANLNDLEEMDLKWQLALLSMRTRKFFQKTGRKITINGSDTAGYDKSKVECFNCHKLGHFAREFRQPKNQDSKNMNQDRFRRTVNVEETASKAMVAIDGAGFDWSYMVEVEVPTNMAIIDLSESEVYTDKTCSKTCLKSFKTLKTQLDDLRIEFNKSEFNLATYKRGLASVEDQLVFYKKRMSKSGVGFVSYNAVPPPLTGLFLPPKLDLSNSSLEEFQQLEFEGYRPKTSNSVSEYIYNEVKESTDAPLVKELVSDDKLEKKTIFPTVTKIEFVRPKQQENPVKKPVKLTAITIKGKGWYLGIIIQWPKAVSTTRPNSAVVNVVRANQKLMVDVLPLEEIPKEVKSLAKVKSVQNNVLFKDAECVILSPDFKLLDESQVLLRVPRKNNMYSVDLKNVTPSGGKFEGKADEGYFVGYSVNSKAFRVFNSRTKIVKETMHITFLENKPNVVGSGPTWLFNIDTLTKIYEL